MKVLIIGGDAAGMSAASQIRRRQPDWHVTVLEQGPFTSYAACGIPYYLAGDIDNFDDLVVVTPEQFREKRGIDVRTSWQATQIDIAAKKVLASDENGEQHSLPYDRLLVATGATPIVPAWPGGELEGVLTLRNLPDARRLEDLLADRPRRAVIVGAGYIGLEMAEALRRRGLEVTVVERLSGAMGGAEQRVTDLLLEEMERQGIETRFDTAVEGFSGTQRLETVETDQGPVAADLALLALGVRPASQLAAEAGIALGNSGAIAVDDRQRTSSADIFAAGDCAESHHLALGAPAWVPLALAANRQGRVAGAVIADGDERFPGIVGSAVTRLFDLVIARTGIDEAAAKGAGIDVESVDTSAPSKAHYFPGHDPLWIKLSYRADNHKILGAWLVGKDESAAKRADIIATAITAGMTVQQLADLDLSYAPPFAPVWDPVLQVANKARFKLARAAE